MDFPFSTIPPGIDWSAVVAPYWYNISTRDMRSGSIHYKTVSRVTDVDVTGKIDSLAASHLCGFATTRALIVTWEQVGYDKVRLPCCMHACTCACCYYFMSITAHYLYHHARMHLPLNLVTTIKRLAGQG